MFLTFIFKVNHQGQVTDFKFSEIHDIDNVRIDSEIKSAACIIIIIIKCLFQHAMCQLNANNVMHTMNRGCGFLSQS